MKKRVLLALGACLMSLHAYGQSSVTLYGIIDDAIQYAHNPGAQRDQVGLVSGQMAGTRWGLSGTEDLGGGIATVFRVENGFNINTGALQQGGRLFGRQAYVGLQSNTYGTFSIGRQYDALRDLVLPTQGNKFLEYFSAPGDVDSGDGTIRMDNVVKWASPVLSGFKFVTTYSFGGITGSPGSGQTWGGGLSYEHGPWQAAAGFLHIDNGNALTSARGTTTSGSLFGSVVNSAYQSAKSINIVRASSNYTIGQVTFGGYYSFSQYSADAASNFKGSERFNNVSVFAMWQVSPLVQLEVGYDILKSSGDSSATYHQASLAAGYLLSKRTDLYAITSYGHASGANGLGAAQAVIADSAVDPGKASQVLFITGVRHRF